MNTAQNGAWNNARRRKIQYYQDIIGLAVVSVKNMCYLTDMADHAAVLSSLESWRKTYLNARLNLKPRSPLESAPSPLGTAIVGVRRCGKTYSAIEMSKHLPAHKVFYYNFEDPLVAQVTDAIFIDELLTLATQAYSQTFSLLVLDEIQNVPSWERWVRSALDQRRFSLIITGSSAKLLSGEISTALTGRVLQLERWPLSYAEFLQFMNKEPSDELEHIQVISEYTKYGGFPEVVLQKSMDVRDAILQQYYNDIIFRDVLGRYEIRNRRALDQIITYYFTNPSSLHSMSALKKAFGVSLDLASGYTRALVDAFMVFEVERFHPNLKVQSRDPKKIYVVDTGMRRVASRSHSADFGKDLENLVYLELRRRKQRIFYYYEKQEVDFVTVEALQPKQAIQVCATGLEDEKTREREISGLLNCMKSLNLNKGLILTLNHKEKLRMQDCEINIEPLYNWLE